jgi:2-(1,2-epoxy-1,2-dihydrophenyl)acetyl-CoA isomerase
MLRTERRESVDVVWLDRPERRNAMVPELMDALADYFHQLPSEPPRPVVLSGAGGAFCVGADLTWLGARADPAQGVAELVAAHHGAVRAMLEAPSPVIAAVDGAAAGGGLSLALAADYRVAGPAASFTTAYFRLGLPPDGGTSVFLARSVGLPRAMELLLTNRTLRAQEALAWGLVHEAADESAVERACQVADGMLRVSAATLLATRRLMDLSGILAQLQREGVAMRAAARRPAFKAALETFLERV